MSERNEDPRVTQMKSVTLIEFLNFIDNSGKAACAFCGHPRLLVPREDATDGPALITTPTPLTPGTGVWAYMAYCEKCGFAHHFDAMQVSTHIVKGRA
ncbi:hypothetical protein D9M70_606420 [compost metagenome]